MKSFISAIIFIAITYFSLESFIIIHHEMNESKYVELGKKYHSVCRFPMGEGVLIDSDWVLTTAYVAAEISSDVHDGLHPKATIEATDYEIAKTFLHPGFNGTDNDIALI